MPALPDTLITELQSLSDLQQRIDQVAWDLVRGERKYTAIEPLQLAELLGVTVGFTREWMNPRAWALRKNITGEFLPRAGDALLMDGHEGLLGWSNWVSTEIFLQSSTGIVFRFFQLTDDGKHFELFSPYVETLELEGDELEELCFELVPYCWNALEWQSTYLYEMDCDERDVWPKREIGFSEEEIEQMQAQYDMLVPRRVS